MDDAERAHLYTCADHVMELVESDCRKDEAAWAARAEALDARSLRNVLRLMSKLAAYQTILSSGALRIPLPDALTGSRLALMQEIDEG